MSFRPWGATILVKKKAEEKTESGIFVPTSKDEENKGTILRVGEPLRMKISEGDTALYKKSSGINVTLEGEQYLLIKEEDILGIFVEEQ